mmetsp:Transcript_99048/g.275749  ORF Transcript_99048/g.275749 Transcript_99048/m.275749 type:complete len:278 (-) Transcript_99048:919-1752(-)
MAFRCFSIFCVTGPSGTLMRICSLGPSSARRLPLVSSESTKPSVNATHSPVSMRVRTRCWPFLMGLSLPNSLRLAPLSTGVQPLAMRRSSRCFFTSAVSSLVASVISTKDGLTSLLLASAKASSSAPRPTRFNLPWALRSTPSTTCSELSMPVPIKVLSANAASAISSGVIRTSSRRSSLIGWSTSNSIRFASGMLAPVPRGRTNNVPQAVTSVTQSVSSVMRAGYRDPSPSTFLARFSSDGASWTSSKHQRASVPLLHRQSSRTYCRIRTRRGGGW